jgi:hypothetical protein
VHGPDRLKVLSRCAIFQGKVKEAPVKNPDGGESIAHRTPQEILDEIAALDAESTEVLAEIRGLL